MKAEELMIGDWVICNYYSDKPCYMQFGVGDFAKYGFEFCGPIPLTPKILEKNGWEERPTGYVFYTDGKRYDNSLWYIFCSNTFVINSAEFQIKYVHELQHALRLCGIDKEIVL